MKYRNRSYETVLHVYLQILCLIRPLLPSTQGLFEVRAISRLIFIEYSLDNVLDGFFLVIAYSGLYFKWFTCEMVHITNHLHQDDVVVYRG